MTYTENDREAWYAFMAKVGWECGLLEACSYAEHLLGQAEAQDIKTLKRLCLQLNDLAKVVDSLMDDIETALRVEGDEE